MDATVARLRSRQGLLWVCQRNDLREGEAPHDNSTSPIDARLRYRAGPSASDRALAAHHWEAVWLQGAASPILMPLREAANSAKRTLAILSSETDALVRPLSPDIMAVHVLPGMLDEGPPDSVFGGLKARKRDKTEMALAARIASFPRRTLVVVGAKEPSDLFRLFEALEDSPIHDLAVIVWWEGSAPPPKLDSATVDLTIKNGTAQDAATWLASLGVPRAEQVPETTVRIGKKLAPLSQRELAPIAGRFRIIMDSDLSAPAVLTADDLRAFLSGNLDSLTGFAAGLPVHRAYRTETNKTLAEELRSRIDRLKADNQIRYSIVELPAEGGAGTTTLLRLTAFELAQHGIPVLLLRPDTTDIDIEDLLAFSSSLENAMRIQGVENQPIAIFADAEHEHISIERLVPKTLAAHGREVLVVRVVSPAESSSQQPVGTDRKLRLPTLRAVATAEEVAACRTNFEKATSRWQLPISVPSLAEWQGFEARMRWRNTEERDESLFWVALRYFLLEGWSGAGEGPQDALGHWIKKRTDSISVEPRLGSVLDAIAALSSFRIVAPLTTVLRPVTGGSIGSSEVGMFRQLSEIVEWDGFSQSMEDQTVRFRHPSLAQEYLRQRGAETERQRLEKLVPTLRTLSPGRPGDLALAELLATDIVPRWEERKDSEWDWRLLLFSTLPPILSNSSKPILHHWARCLYNQAKKDDPQGKHVGEILLQAEDLLQKATKLPKRFGRDENLSHLFNTLGTVAARSARYLAKNDPEASADAWGRSRRAFVESIRLGDGGNVEAFLGFAERLIEHNSTVATPDLGEIAEALELLDKAQNLTEQGGEYDDVATEQLRVRALGFLDLDKARLKELQDSGQHGLAAYCQARLAERQDPTYGREAALALLDAEEALRPLTGAGLELFLRLNEKTEGKRNNFSKQMELYQRLETDKDDLDYFQAFRVAVLCYQLGRSEEGGRRFRQLRERSRAAGNTWPRVGDFLREPSSPNLRRRLSMRVDRITSDWRGTAFIPELKQSIPFRPRHFSPMPHQGSVVSCEIKFEFSGPLAIP